MSIKPKVYSEKENTSISDNSVTNTSDYSMPFSPSYPIDNEWLKPQSVYYYPIDVRNQLEEIKNLLGAKENIKAGAVVRLTINGIPKTYRVSTVVEGRDTILVLENTL
jgi:hypothetical protein